MLTPRGKCLISVFTLFFLCLNSFGQVWEKEDPGLPNGCYSVLELPNGNLVYADRVGLECVDPFGNSLWGYNLEFSTVYNIHPIFLKLSAGGNIVVAGVSNISQHFIVHISPQGAILNEFPLPMYLPLNDAFAVLPNDEIIALYPTSILKLDSTGDSLWWKSLPQPPTGGTYKLEEIIPTLDGGYAMVGVQDNSSDDRLACVKIDTGGTIQWHKTYILDTTYNGQTGSYEGLSIVQAADSSFLMSYSTFVFPGPGTYGLLKISSNGDSLDLFEVPTELQRANLIVAADGNPVLYRRNDFLSGWDIGKMDWQGNLLWTKAWDMPGRDIEMERVVPLMDSGFAVCGFSRSEFSNALLGAYVARLDDEGNPYESLVWGTSYFDLDSNCIRDLNEPVVPSLVLEVSGDTNLTFSTDIQGGYALPLNAGNYQFDLSGLSNYWALSGCAASTSLNLSGQGDSVQLDFPISPVVLCPDLRVDIFSGPLAACFEGDFWVSYLNAGTDSATNAFVEVSLPPSVTLDSATLPFTIMGTGAIRFNLGTVLSLQGENFRLDVSVDCPTDPLDILGTTECAIARIYPDSSCLPPSGSWDGSNIEVSIECLPSDSLRFAIYNTSSSAMASTGTYLVLEDNIMRISNPFQLPGNDSLVFYEAANGSTWTLISDQSLGHPSSVQPLVSLEGCGQNGQGQVSLGIVSQMPQDDSHPATSIFCATYVGAYDPNDKSALPTGTGSLNEIETNTELDYMIRFQNEGTYYAQDVLLLDTLDPNLDWSTLTVISASHDFSWELSPQGLLAVTFSSIVLPWKDLDEAGSQGFVKFRITPDPDLQPGQRIENRAGIYFDFNPPIITNTVVHHIATNMFGLVSVDEWTGDQTLALEVFPNPFRRRVGFRTEKAMGKAAQFTLMDVQGQIVHSEIVGAVSEFEIQTGDLPAGIYFFRLDNGKGVTATGRLIRFK